MKSCSTCGSPANQGTAHVTGQPLCEPHYRQLHLELSRLGNHVPKIATLFWCDRVVLRSTACPPKATTIQHAHPA